MMSTVNFEQARRNAERLRAEQHPTIDDIADCDDYVEEVRAPSVRVQLPAEFWDARALLRRLRDAAFWLTVSPDALLMHCLARTAAFIPADTRMFSRRSPSSLNLLVAIIGPSGSGKSSSANPARRIVAAPEGMDDQVPLGSGEGIAELFMGGKGDKRKQVRHNAFMYGDEGRILQAFRERKGTTLDQTLCAAFTGEPIGNANGSKETSRIARDYGLGVVVNLTPSAVAHLVETSEGGLPQRFLFAAAQHPDIPDPLTMDAVDAENLPRIDVSKANRRLTFAPHIQKAIIRSNWLQSRPEDTLTEDERRELEGVHHNPLDKHREWIRARVAAILAIWDGRNVVNDDDWALAKMITDSSCRVRDAAIQEAVDIRLEEESKDNERTLRLTELKQLAARNVNDKLSRIARPLVSIIRTEKKISYGKLRKRLASGERHMFEEAVRLAERESVIMAVIEGEDTFFVPR